MSNNTTFQDYKDQVARNMGYQNFAALSMACVKTEDHLSLSLSYDAAAELYAQSKWQEACEAQKKVCAHEAEMKYRSGTSEELMINKDSILNAPNAPYPNDKP